MNKKTSLKNNTIECVCIITVCCQLTQMTRPLKIRKREREKKMVINSIQLMRHQPGDQIVIHTHK